MICSQVSFTVTALSGAKLDEAEKAPGGLLKKFKLESSMATSNMNFFDSGGVAIERYATPFDICKAFYKVRLETYAKRKARTRRPPYASMASARRWRPHRPPARRRRDDGVAAAPRSPPLAVPRERLRLRWRRAPRQRRDFSPIGSDRRRTSLNRRRGRLMSYGTRSDSS